jgi:hypothetical protein
MSRLKSQSSIKRALLFATFAAFGTSGSALAAKFANQFVEFELPPKWQCSLEGAEWVCQNTDPAKKKEAIIVLAAKLRGDQDTIEKYLDYLKSPKQWTSLDGKPVRSEPKYAKSQDLNGQLWVDALHLESEIPGFYTRYLATVKEDIGVLVTYSMHKDKHQQYIGDFDNLVKTLRVFRKAGGLNVNPSNGNLFNLTSIPAGISPDSVFSVPKDIGGGEKKPKKDSEGTFFLLVIGAAVVAVMLIRRRRK